jgi:hypothetical protein
MPLPVSLLRLSATCHSEKLGHNQYKQEPMRSVGHYLGNASCALAPTEASTRVRTEITVFAKCFIGTTIPLRHTELENSRRHDTRIRRGRSVGPGAAWMRDRR